MNLVLKDMTSWVERQEELKKLKEELFQVGREECRFHCYCIIHKGYNGPTCHKLYEECCKCGDRKFHNSAL